MKIYADTSVFGGVFDHEFSKTSKQFFNEVDSGRFVLVTSAMVEAEIEPAPEKIRLFFANYAEKAYIAIPNQAAFKLQLDYINSGVVTEKSLDDALHVAIATVSGCDIIVSWNFKHIVHFDKIPKYNAVNVLNGYKHIGIYSPHRRLFNMMIHEPECVAMKRRGAEYVARLLSGKSRQEQLEFWIKRTERLISKQKQKQEKSKSKYVTT